jgi:hypothetical protein
VLFEFEQGEQLEVVEIVTGEVVSGNDQWLKVTTEDRFVFVHSSLATRAPDAPEPQAAVETEQEESTSPVPKDKGVSRTDWVLHQVGELSFERPPTMSDATDFFTDAELLASLGEMYDIDPEEFFEPITEAIEIGLLDGYLMDLNSGLSVFITHEDLGDLKVTPAFIRRILEQLEEGNGGEVIDSEIVELPIGEAIRLHALRRIQAGTFNSEQEVLKYAVTIGTRIYYVEFGSTPEFFDDLVPTIETIAATFSSEESLLASST